jgi:hypothetical protein
MDLPSAIEGTLRNFIISLQIVSKPGCSGWAIVIAVWLCMVEWQQLQK